MDRQVWRVAASIVVVVAAELALAGTTGLPWETPLQTLQQSLTGPVAMVIAILAMAVAGAGLVFGGEMGDFTRRIMMVVLGISVLLLGAQLITVLFSGTGGATV